jgi:hypothetical protein
MTITMDVVCAAYVSTRESIRALKAQIEEMEVMQKKREDYLLGELQKMGAQNIKTGHGTVYIALKESVTVSDADSFFQWVRENDKFEFLNKAANKTAVLEMMGEKRDALVPPGVNYSAMRVAQIRKGA